MRKVKIVKMLFIILVWEKLCYTLKDILFIMYSPGSSVSQRSSFPNDDATSGQDYETTDETQNLLSGSKLSTFVYKRASFALRC